MALPRPNSESTVNAKFRNTYKNYVSLILLPGVYNVAEYLVILRKREMERVIRTSDPSLGQIQKQNPKLSILDKKHAVEEETNLTK